MTDSKMRFLAMITFAMMTSCGLQDLKSKEAPSESVMSSFEDKVSSDEGEISWESKANGQGATFTYDLKIPYGRLYTVASRVVDFISPRTCQNINSLQSDHHSKYNGGEVPCGKIIDDQWKELVAFDFEETATVKSGYTITVKPFQFPVWLHRTSLSGVYTESDLEFKQQIPKTSSQKFAQDISVKWTPTGKGLNMGLCLNIPGGRLSAPTRTVYANAKKKTWYGKFSATSGFEITPGSATWEYGRGCFAIDLDTANLSDVGAVKVVATQAPYLHKLTYSGLKIKITNWILRLIDNILSIFNASIKKAVIKKVSSTINQIADKDIETGAWFTQVSADKMLQEQGAKIQAELLDVMQRTNLPMKSLQVKKFLKDKCRLLKFSKSEKWTQKHHVFCADLIDDLRIEILPFHRDQSSADKGCYDHYANIHSSKNADGVKKWWAKECKISTRFSIHISENAVGYIEELHDLILEHIDSSQIPERWQSLLDKYKINADALHLVLEELEKRGIEELEDLRLESELPSVLAEIQNKYSAFL